VQSHSPWFCICLLHEAAKKKNTGVFHKFIGVSFNFEVPAKSLKSPVGASSSSNVTTNAASPTKMQQTAVQVRTAVFRT
jgi:hypothetical protein